MEIHNIEEEEIRPLIFNYIFHFILFLLIFILHLIIYNKIFWISDIFAKIFIFCVYFAIIYFIFPIIPFFLIILKIFKLKIIEIFKKISLIFLIISIVIGLLISAIILINTINSKKFCKECPFNIPLTNLNYNFDSFYKTEPDEEDIKDQCKNRKCILDSTNLNKEYPYIYLCNYDPSYEFDDEITYKRYLPNGEEITTENQLICSFVNINYFNINFNNKELYDYLDLCYYLTDFYYCERFNKPEKTYDLDLDAACPETSYLFLLYILCILIIIIDIVISMLPWGVEFISLKRIVEVMRTSRRKANSNNSTAKSSVISNNEEVFKKENTLIIISPLNNDENIIDINKAKNNYNNSNNGEKNINNVNNNIFNINKNINKNSIKDSTNLLLNKNINKDYEEDEKDNNIIKPINIVQSSERIGLKKNNFFLSSDENTSNNAINIFNKNNVQRNINISTDFYNNQVTKNINIRDKIEEDNKK